MKKRRILIVENDLSVAEEIGNILETKGYTIAGIAQSGKEAITLVPESEPDLILIDILLAGELDGIETSRKIRKKYNVPQIYLTDHSDEEIFKRAKKPSLTGIFLSP